MFELHVEAIVFEEFGERCARCGSAEQLSLDHHRPLQEGHRLLDNAVVLCLACNSAKSTRPPEEFYDGLTLRRIERVLTWCRARRLAEACASDTDSEAAA